MLTWINAGCDVGRLPKCQAMHPTSVLGQTEKFACAEGSPLKPQD